jgi:hypothetical protein
MTRANFLRFIALVLFVALTACKTTQPPAPVRVAAPVQVFEPEPVAVPTPAPQPVYVEPDYTTLPGHSSVTTPVPVEPVDVQDMGPVIE